MADPRSPSTSGAKGAALKAKLQSSLKERMRQKAARDGQLPPSPPADPFTAPAAFDSTASAPSGAPASSSVPKSAEREFDPPFWMEETPTSAPVETRKPYPAAEADETLFWEQGEETPTHSRLENAPPQSERASEPEPREAPSPRSELQNFGESPWPWERDDEPASGATDPVHAPTEPSAEDSGEPRSPTDAPLPLDAEPEREPRQGIHWVDETTSAGAPDDVDAAAGEHPDQTDETVAPVWDGDPFASLPSRVGQALENARAEHQAQPRNSDGDGFSPLGESLEPSPRLPELSDEEKSRRAALDEIRRQAREARERAEQERRQEVEPQTPSEAAQQIDEDATAAASVSDKTESSGEPPKPRRSLRERLGDLDAPTETPDWSPEDLGSAEDLEALTRSALAAMASGQAHGQGHLFVDGEAREAAEREAREAAEREAREAAEREARETAEREAREAAEREARETAEREAREAAEREAREAAEREAREAAEREARETAEREAREAAEREAREAAEREAAEREGRETAEREGRETAEREAREAAEREAAEREARETAEREARETAEREARETAEREARETAEREAREAAEREAREAAEREARETAEREAREAAEREAREAAESEAREFAEQDAREARAALTEDSMPQTRTDAKGKPLPDGPVSLKDMLSRARAVAEKAQEPQAAPIARTSARDGFAALADRARQAAARSDPQWAAQLDADRLGERGQQIVLSAFARAGFQEGLIALFERGWVSDLANGALAHAAEQGGQWELLDWLERLGARPSDANATAKLRQWQRERGVKPEPGSLARDAGGLLFDPAGASAFPRVDATPPFSPVSAPAEPAAASPERSAATSEAQASAESESLAALDSFGLDALGMESDAQPDPNLDAPSGAHMEQEAEPAPVAAHADEQSLSALDELGLGDLGLDGLDEAPASEDGEAKEAETEIQPAVAEPSAELGTLADSGFDWVDGHGEAASVAEPEAGHPPSEPGGEEAAQPSGFDFGGDFEPLPATEGDAPEQGADANYFAGLLGEEPKEKPAGEEPAEPSFDLDEDLAQSAVRAEFQESEEASEPGRSDGASSAHEGDLEAAAGAADAIAAPGPGEPLQKTEPEAPAGSSEAKIAALSARNAQLQARLLDAMSLEEDLDAMEKRAEEAEEQLAMARSELSFAQDALAQRPSEEPQNQPAMPADEPRAAAEPLAESERAQWERAEQRASNLADLNELAEENQKKALLALSQARQESRDAQTALAKEKEARAAFLARDWLLEIADDNRRDSLLANPVASAAARGDLAALRRSWDNSLPNAEARDTALALACENGRLDCAAWLLARCQADPNGLAGLPVLRAARAGSPDALLLLRRWGADLSRDAEHALRFLARKNLADATRSLCRMGANPNVDGARPLAEALDAEAWDAALVLIEEGARPLSPDGALWPRISARGELASAWREAEAKRKEEAEKAFGFGSETPQG
jgi:hypothetical protein